LRNAGWWGLWKREKIRKGWWEKEGGNEQVCGEWECYFCEESLCVGDEDRFGTFEVVTLTNITTWSISKRLYKIKYFLICEIFFNKL